jgi:dipeptidyl aminopeptidase/acylaminoacyl peptidase
MRGPKNARRVAVLLMYFCSCIWAQAATTVLPDRFGFEKEHHLEKREWTIHDIVEVRRITEVALSDDAEQVAFVIKQSSLALDTLRYGLYIADVGRPGSARKIAESFYLAELSHHPHSKLWTVRADFGAGVQLYDIDDRGGFHALVNVPDTVLDGGYEGITGLDEPRQTGIFSYQWSPDGSFLWYSRPRVRAPKFRKALRARGIEYDDRTMDEMSFFKDSTELEGNELHLLNAASEKDKLLLFARSSSATDNTTFRVSADTISWAPDSRHIQYLSQREGQGDTGVDYSLASIDVRTGQSQLWSSQSSIYEMFSAQPMPNGRDHLVVRWQGAERHLVIVGPEGILSQDFGAVSFRSIVKAWWNSTGDFVLTVRLNDRNGLVHYSAATGELKSFSHITDHLDHCAFSKDLERGVCVRESLMLPPELVVVFQDGHVETLARPNQKYDALRPFRIAYATWTNRFGHPNDGYITYPRNYVRGLHYPVVCITHGNAARNTFVDEQIQWEYPTQVLAERGYFVLSVNEPRPGAEMQDAEVARIYGGRNVNIKKMQFATGFDAVAGMEAALQSLIDSGDADQQKTAIAGFSRGSQVVNLVMTQSKMFHAASSGEGGYLNAGAFWESGFAIARAQYDALFGGSPYDPEALENYRAFSPSFRAREFAGPLLQQYASASAGAGLELYELLQQARIPTELVFYPHEAHVFYQPSHQAAAMQLNIDWFDYWLLGKSNKDANTTERYEKWDTMRKVWIATKKAASSQ